MLSEYHIEICQRSLGDKVSDRALKTITDANLAQDGWRGLIGHHEYHFDHNAFEAGYTYIDKQRNIILEALSNAGTVELTWEAFGRLTHSVQDFYAHSNYLELWAQSISNDGLPPPSQVDALDQAIINHPDLRSGRIYVREVLGFIPLLRPFTRRILPLDSHANMNLDYPERGHLFPYVIEAAVKRTIYEFDQMTAHILKTEDKIALSKFTDL